MNNRNSTTIDFSKMKSPIELTKESLMLEEVENHSSREIELVSKNFLTEVISIVIMISAMV